jgi:hypothetical protein
VKPHYCSAPNRKPPILMLGLAEKKTLSAKAGVTENRATEANVLYCSSEVMY